MAALVHNCSSTSMKLQSVGNSDVSVWHSVGTFRGFLLWVCKIWRSESDSCLFYLATVMHNGLMATGKTQILTPSGSFSVWLDFCLCCGLFCSIINQSDRGFLIFISTKDKGGVPEEMETPHILFVSCYTSSVGKMAFWSIAPHTKKNDGKGNDKDWWSSVGIW